MILLYTPERARRARALSRVSLWLACGLLAGALAVCVILCARVNTGNAQRMLYAVIGLFTLAGWAAIALLALVYRPSAAECRHITSILNGEAEEMEGRLALTSACFQIPKGILVRKAALESDGEKRSLNVDERMKKRLPPEGTRVRVRVVRKFITAFEVLP